MSQHSWNQNPNGLDRRSGSGYHNGCSVGRGSSRGRGSDYTPAPNYNNRQESAAYQSAEMYYDEPRKSDGFAAVPSPTTVDERTLYAVNLQLKPADMGIKATNQQWQREFKGLGAFNHYFGLLSPTNSFGYTLPDIWDGYFHITLAKFTTPLSPEHLQHKFERFNNPVEDLPYIPDIIFHASRLEIYPGKDRPKKRNKIDFIVLPVEGSPEIESFYQKVQPLLTAIMNNSEVNETNWTTKKLEKLHVTIRKYSNVDYKRYEPRSIPIRQFPLEFRCSHLEIKQTREQAIERYESDPTYKWWDGVTEIDRKCAGCRRLITSKNWKQYCIGCGASKTINGKCSGCRTLTTSKDWEGFCIACGKYETIIPLWSTTGNTSHHDDILTQDVQNISLDDLS